MNGHKVTFTTVFVRIPLLLLLISVFCDSTIFALRYRNSMIIIGICGMLLSIGLMLKNKSKLYIPKKKDLIDILFLCFIFLVFVNNWDLKFNNYRYEVLFLIVVILFRYRDEFSNLYVETLLIFLRYFGFLATMATIFFCLFPEVFAAKVLPIVPKAYYANILYCFQRGYQSGFALHYSSNGLFLVLYIGYLFSKIISKEEYKKNILLLLVAYVALFLTAKRAHIVFSVLAIYITYYFGNEERKRTRLFNSIGILLISISSFIVLYQFIPQIGMFINRFSDAFASDNILGERRELFLYAIELFFSNPISGKGWGGYKYLANDSIGQYNEAHNVFLQLLAETGIIGFLIGSAIIISVIIATIHKYRIYIYDKSFNKKELRLLAFSTFYMVFFGMYCMVGNPLYDNQLLLLFMIVSSMGMRKNGQKDD